jgi:branched-chain amino acid transport system permease protein
MVTTSPMLKGFLKSFLVALWFMFLTFPILVVKVNALEQTVHWRWMNMIYVGIGAFFFSFLWRYLLERRQRAGKMRENRLHSLSARIRRDPKLFSSVIGAIGIAALVFPFIGSSYEVSVMTSALMYVMLGLGLNIVVGLAGLLDLGYVAFYAVGAYGYALLNHHFGLGFWVCLPISAFLAAGLGILLGFPVLRLRGDYLAIVTLGFGEIIRLILENWNAFSFGPSGIAGISKPWCFGLFLTPQAANIYMYYIVIVLVLLTIFVVGRLANSRIGRAWMALREDEIACEAMGIDKTRTKLTAFALGATWAGMAGCIFAAKTGFINPASFTFMESAIILSIVVLGGMGSILGIILAALILIVLPEYLRAFSDLRMLIFGASMMLMMVFRPEGLIRRVKHHYAWQGEK